MRRTWGGLGGPYFFLAFLERLLFVWYDTLGSVHSQLSLCQLFALYSRREEKNSRGGNKDTLPLSFRTPFLWRGFFFGVIRAPNLRSRWVCTDESSCCPASGRRNLRYGDVRKRESDVPCWRKEWDCLPLWVSIQGQWVLQGDET